ncbi:MAG: 1,4-alpha-glucan branching protein GlgB [Euzebya sp.]
MTDVQLPGLAAWLAGRRWFSGKDRPLSGATVIDTAAIGTEPAVWLAIIQATYDDSGAANRWLLVLTRAPERTTTALGHVDGVPVVELDDQPGTAASLLSAVQAGTAIRTQAGADLEARSLGLPLAGIGDTVRKMGVEQSNTSVVVGEQAVVKVIRKIEPGPNPDVEINEELTRAGFQGIPPLLGSITGPYDEAMVVVSRFVTGARGAWELAVEEASGLVDHGIAGGMVDLGGLTARLHGSLRSLFATVVSTAADGTRWRAGLRSDAQRTRSILAAAAPDAAAAVTTAVEEVVGEAPAALGLLQRIHGDYHLGQVLRDADGNWQILDFEGEPARPIAERRLPANPAKDVAGMLRSLDYARAQAVAPGADPTQAAAWAARARNHFLDGYAAADTGTPDSGAGDTVRPWLRAFEVEKLLYEIRYEAANRPQWLSIPLAALGIAQPDQGHGPSTDTSADLAPNDKAALAGGSLHEPHRLLGYHQDEDAYVVRAWRPGADAVAYLPDPDAKPMGCQEVEPGLFEARVEREPQVGAYRLRVAYGPDTYDLVDPYSFPPSLGDVDRHLLAEGRHEQAWTVMGANRRTMSDIQGVAFAVWAPNARAVRVVGDFNSWDGRLHPMRSLGSSGIWELFLPDVADGAAYKYELVTAEGAVATRADPWAKWSQVPPGTASRVFTSEIVRATAESDLQGGRGASVESPVSTYEVHLGSWRHRDAQPLSYREFAEELGAYITRLGFTHVEFLPVAEHPFGGSWGYQVTGQFAPTSRYGSPDDFRFMVDHLHALGIGVIVDWVPAHFPRDEWALRRFDGTALYEHADPRLGEHPDWGTMVFNYGRLEVRNFLVASALFWLESMGVDGLRVDAVASMLYLDYSRKAGEWVPNEFGGRENLRAVELLQEVNATAYKRNPDTFIIAEESTAWPGVTRPTHLGGLGFGFKWNMGWMNDTLAYFAKEPIYRRWHHNQMTFGLMYAFSENFVLPLSHDEVVHGKGSLLGKMPGDRWQQFANLRALYGWMWAHPGKQLLFMGQEFGQAREWSEERELDWFLLEDTATDEPNRHAALQDLVADLNSVYRANPALWRRDNQPEGFGWIDANNADDNLLSFVRHGATGDPDVAVIANLSPTPYHDVRFGLPSAGHWQEILNTDAEIYGGSNVGNMGGVSATADPWHGRPASALITCPPLAVVWLQGPATDEESAGNIDG